MSHLTWKKNTFSCTRESGTVFNWNPQEICGHITNSLGKTTATNNQKNAIAWHIYSFLDRNSCQLICAIRNLQSCRSLQLRCTILYIICMLSLISTLMHISPFALDTFYDVKWCHSHNMVNIQKKGRLWIFFKTSMIFFKSNPLSPTAIYWNHEPHE